MERLAEGTEIITKPCFITWASCKAGKIVKQSIDYGHDYYQVMLDYDQRVYILHLDSFELIVKIGT